MPRPLTAGTDNNGGAGFQIGDKGGEGVVNSLKYKADRHPWRGCHRR